MRSSHRANGTQKQINSPFGTPTFGGCISLAYICPHINAASCSLQNRNLMKRIYSLLGIIPLLLASAFFLTACVYDPYYDDDPNPYDPYYPYNPGYNRGDRGRARMVSGEWQGDFGMFYRVADPNTGEMVQFDSRNTYVLFQPDYYGARSGWGKQIDFYERGPLARRYHRFRWTVNGGTLQLRYPADHGLDVDIRDYYLSNTVFEGYTGNSNFHFILRKLSFTGWDTYSGDYYDYDNTGWSWSISVRGANAEAGADAPLRVVSGRRSRQ